MSQFSLEGGLITEDAVALTGNTATTVYTATLGATPISSIVVTPTSGTPNLTIGIYNASDTLVGRLRVAVAMTAGTPFIWNEVFVLAANYKIKVTSSSGTGDMEVFVTHGIGAAAGKLRAGS